jgi:hypothetical protein
MSDRLWRVFAELSVRYPKINLDGIGDNCVIRLQNKDRKVAISDIKGGWWVEFGQLETSPIREGLYHTKDEVLRLVHEWLR